MSSRTKATSENRSKYGFYLQLSTSKHTAPDSLTVGRQIILLLHPRYKTLSLISPKTLLVT